VTLNSAANNLAAGVYSANIQFNNLNSGATLNRQFTLQVGLPLVQNGGFETGDFSFWTLSGDPSGAPVTSTTGRSSSRRTTETMPRH
jgi:hypothetical protein